MHVCRHKHIVNRLVQLWDPKRPNIDTNRTGEYTGMKILSRAIEYDWEAVAESLIERLHPFDKDSEEATLALCECTSKGWYRNLSLLLKKGVNPNSRSVTGEPALLTACKTDQPLCARALVDAGSEYLESAVLICIWMGYEECFRMVWLRLIAVYMPRSKSENPAQHLETYNMHSNKTQRGEPDMAKIRQNTGRKDDKIVTEEPDGNRPWLQRLENLIRVCACVASLKNRFDMLKVIMSCTLKSVDTHAYIQSRVHVFGTKIRDILQDWAGFHCLHTIVPNLLRNVHTIDPSCPVLCSVVKAYFRCTSYLLENKANVHVTDANGISALTWSCTVGNLDVCKALLRNGARVSLTHGQKTMSFRELRHAYVDRGCEEADHYVNSRLRHVMGEAEWRKRHEANKSKRLIVSPMMAALIKGLLAAVCMCPNQTNMHVFRCLRNRACVLLMKKECATVQARDEGGTW
jgi:hypothetical protein